MVAAVWHGREPRRRLGAIIAVSLVHVGLIAAFAVARQSPPREPVFLPVFEIFMTRSAPPAAPEAPQEIGGGAPAAASRIHRAKTPPVERTELPAPPVAAPLAEIMIGLAPVSANEPAAMQGGGEGEGAGTGVGKGNGAGGGGGAGPVLIRGPQGAVMTANVSSAAMRALPGPYAVLECHIRTGSDRLEGCRIKEERPAGAGIGQAALGKAAEFRYRPPSRLGRFSGRHRQTVAIAFPPPEPSSSSTGGRH